MKKPFRAKSPPIQEHGLREHHLAPVEVLAGRLGLVEGPLVGGLLLGMSISFMLYVPPRDAMARTTAKTAVTMAISRVKDVSLISSSSWGLGSSTSVIVLFLLLD